MPSPRQTLLAVSLAPLRLLVLGFLRPLRAGLFTGAFLCPLLLLQLFLFFGLKLVLILLFELILCLQLIAVAILVLGRCYRCHG